MYDIQKYQRDISVEEYVREYVNVAEFIEYCKECPNYNAVWSCPPYDFEPEDFWNRFSELHIKAGFSQRRQLQHVQRRRLQQTSGRGLQTPGRHEIFYRIHRRQRRTDSKQADGYRVRVGTGG